MGQLPSEVATHVQTLQGLIDPQDVFTDEDDGGLPSDPHVTVLYGLHTEDPKEIDKHLGSNRKLPGFRLGSLSLFTNSESDVLKIDVDSQDLHKLHSHFRSLPHTLTHSVYKPHATVAYVKSGTGQKYLNLSNPLEGYRGSISSLTFSTPSEKKYWIPLRRPTAEDIVYLVALGDNPMRLAEMLTAMAVGTRPMPMGFIRPIYPSTTRRKTVSKPSLDLQPKGASVE